MSEHIHRRIDAALGRIPCDLIIRNVSFLDVFSCQFRVGDVAVIDGVIVALESGLKARCEVNGRGKHLVPGFIDAHVHVESSLMTPGNFESQVTRRGTTTAICDPHEIANVFGTAGIKYFLGAAKSLAMDLRVMLSSCVPATHMETNGAGALSANDLWAFRDHPKALGLAEMMNFPGVLSKSPDMMVKLSRFCGVPIDGHCPGLRGNQLSAYIAAGIGSCHESVSLEEAREKHLKGMGVWIREGSVARDLKALIPLLDVACGSSIGFCTDDRNPLDIRSQGHVDHLVREAIQYHVPLPVVYRSASFSAARHYGLRGKGAVAPGYQADLILLEDPNSVAIKTVWIRGQSVADLDGDGAYGGPEFGHSIRAVAPVAADLEGPTGNVHVIDVQPGRIITGRSVGRMGEPGVARLTVLERHGKGSRPANAYVRGFGESLQGAIASSVAHDSHNLIVVGSNTQDMTVALSALIACGGGFCIVQRSQVLALLELPIAGLMSPQSPQVIIKGLEGLRGAARSIGCGLTEPFLQLAFLSLPVIPSLKLTDKGLVDVERFEIIAVAA